MKRILAFSLILLCLRAQAQTSTNATIKMSDGVDIDALYIIPATPPPSTGYPAIVFVHGFQGSKEDMRAMALAYAQRGYVTSAYSVRGQGASGGLFDFFTSTRVLEDLKSLISFTSTRPNVNKDRVAVAGGSQGGIHAWAAAAAHLGVRTVFSAIANGRFDENWIENNALNWTFARTISIANVRFVPGLKDSINRATSSGDLNSTRAMLTGYRTTEREEAVDVPVAIICSYFDGFFNQSAALRQFTRIPTAKRMVLYPAGHELPKVAAQRAYTDRLQEQWFEYWLKDNTAFASVASPDSAVMLFDALTNEPHLFALRDSALWLHAPATPPSGLTARTFYFSPAGLTETPPAAPAQNTITYVNNLNSTPVVFRSQPFAADAMITGSIGNAVLEADGTGKQYQMVLLLFDVDPANGKTLPITRGYYQVPVNTPGSREELRFDLTSVAATIKAGHVLEARVHSGIGLIPNTQVEFGNYVLGPVENSVNTLYMGSANPSRFTLHFLTGMPTGIASAAPAENTLTLEQNYPNPFGAEAATSSTLLRFHTAARSATLRVFDGLGRLVATPFNGTTTASGNSALFDATALPAGIYHAVLTDADGRSATRRMVFNR